MTRCEVVGKRKYRSKLDCLFANARRPLMARAYHCAHCGGWHLTRGGMRG